MITKCGKTSAILQLGEELNMQVVKLNLSQLEELGDLVGFPVKEFQVKNAEGKELWITEQEITTANSKGFKVVAKRMSHAAPEWIQGKGEGGFLILDDYTRADARFMQATMELIDRQEYVSWKLPKNWHIVLTTNPDNGDYNVTTLDVAQKTRFISTEIKFDVEVWAEWAEEIGIDSRCINFLLLNPELVNQRINPRSVTTFFNSISSIPEFKKELPLIQMIAEGSVGEEFGAMFNMFINNELDKIINPVDAMTKDEAYVKGALRSAVGTGDDYRADIASVLATRVINYSLSLAKKQAISDVFIQRLVLFTTDWDVFNDDLKYVLVKSITGGNKVKFAKLMLNQQVIAMALK